MTSDIVLSIHLKTSGRLAHSRSFLLSSISVVNPAAAAGAVSLVNSSRNVSVRVSYDPAASDQSRAAQSRQIQHVLQQGGNSSENSQHIIHLLHLGHS